MTYIIQQIMRKGEEKKTKALAVCENCRNTLPVLIRPDESIEPVGAGCGCESPSYRILEDDDLP